jgi:hypothetical protein
MVSRRTTARFMGGHYSNASWGLPPCHLDFPWLRGVPGALAGRPAGAAVLPVRTGNGLITRLVPT